jgi:hypothetical protein
MTCIIFYWQLAYFVISLCGTSSCVVRFLLSRSQKYEKRHQQSADSHFFTLNTLHSTSTTMLSSVASAALRRSSVAAARPTLRAAFFSSGSHDDFAPQRKVVEGEDQALKSIQDHVDNNPVMLYMKGNPSQPQCE